MYHCYHPLRWVIQAKKKTNKQLYKNAAETKRKSISDLRLCDLALRLKTVKLPQTNFEETARYQTSQSNAISHFMSAKHLFLQSCRDVLSNSTRKYCCCCCQREFANSLRIRPCVSYQKISSSMQRHYWATEVSSDSRRLIRNVWNELKGRWKHLQVFAWPRQSTQLSVPYTTEETASARAAEQTSACTRDTN